MKNRMTEATGGNPVLNEMKRPNEFSSTDSMAKEMNNRLENQKNAQNSKEKYEKNGNFHEICNNQGDSILNIENSYKNTQDYSPEFMINTDRELNIYFQDDIINRNKEDNTTAEINDLDVPIAIFDSYNFSDESFYQEKRDDHTEHTDKSQKFTTKSKKVEKITKEDKFGLIDSNISKKLDAPMDFMKKTNGIFSTGLKALLYCGCLYSIKRPEVREKKEEEIKK